MSETIKVVVRVRPMNLKEKERGCSTITQIDEEINQIVITKPEEEENVKTFAFDHVFGEQSLQQTVYTKTAYNLVENVLTGYNGTIFAYGQTGCGKTHSMVGKVEDELMQGIIPRSFGHILKSISETQSKEFLIRCSFIQIYNEEVRDLLARDVKNKLQIKQSPDKGVFIKDLLINTAKTHEELMEYMNLGNRNRSTGETAMNKDSSRSHLLFCLYLESAQTKEDESEERKYIASKLNLVDLAGSQRISKTGVSGDRLKEAQKINLSLSALGNVISALVDGKSQHIPYRDSKLTRLLQDSLGGNTKTVMIANCSPADYNFDETLSTLRYASRAKFIKNKPIINEDPKDALLKEYANEIKNLKRMLQQQGKQSPDLIEGDGPDHSEIDEKLKQKQKELDNEKMEKKMLMQKILELENRHVEAKDVHIDLHMIENIEKARVEAEADKLHQFSIQKKKSDIEEEQRELETNHNAVDQADKYKHVLKKLKNKVRSLEQEIKDINQENYTEKEETLEGIRAFSKENKLLEAIINAMLQSTEFQLVKAQCKYSQEAGEYRVPPFYLKNKQVLFPKLPENQSIDMIRQMQENRQIVLEESQQLKSRDENSHPASMGSPCPIKTGNGKDTDLAVRSIIKQARSGKPMSTRPEKKKQVWKVQLEPIRKQ